MKVADPDYSEALKLKSKPKIKTPKMYRVILHNDHYTTMEFVVEILIKVFHKPVAEATQIMLDVHKRGRGNVGVFTRDIAQTRVKHVQFLARQSEFPLKCTYEEA